MTPIPEASGSESSPPHILILEDEDAHAELIRRGFELSSRRFRITIAPTLKEARSALCDDPPDLIIADWLLPDGKGIDILPNKNGRALIPLIIMTSHGDQTLAVEMMKAGAIDYLVKSDVAFRELPHTAERVLREWKNIQERKRSENRFRLLLENSGSGIGYYDIRGTVILFNSIAARYMGGVPSDFTGRSITDLYSRDLASLIQERMNAALDDPGTRFYEDLITLQTGRWWFSSAYTAVRDAQGEITGVQIISTDITAQKAAEQALKEGEERFRTVADWTYDWEYWVTPDRSFMYISPSAERITGYRADEFIADPGLIERIIHPDDRRIWDSHVMLHERTKDSNSAIGIEFRIFAKDGTEHWIAHVCRPIFTGDGTWMGRRVSNRDISDEKTAEKALKENEERFRHISSLITDFAYSCKKGPAGDFTIDWMTGSVDQITGYSIEEIQDRSCWKFLIIEDDLPVFEKNVTGLAPGESARCELRIRPKDGRITWLASFAECVADPVNPDCHRLYGGCRDITERKRADQSLLMANRKLNLMNMVAWHDIQNKLTGLWGYIELTKDLVSDAQVMKFLEIEGEILHVIYRQLASTKEYQEMGIQPPQWLSVEGIMRSITISGKTSSLRVRVDVDGLEIFGDPVIERVFGHLVENSVLHGQTVTEIRVWYRETASGLVLIYEDNGIGIPESLRPGLFDKNYGKTGGFDMFFVHDLLEASGMAITETGIPGKGVRFEITVPREAFRFRRAGEEVSCPTG
jgi:PAS domain S-box-containing protein